MPRWTRQVLFGDVDAMYASSAIIANPSLAGSLVAVGSPPPRGIITSATYPVRRHGVTAAMPTAHALRLCPDLVLVQPDFSLYRRMQDRMRAVTDRLFPETAWTSIDEFYAETTNLQTLHPDPAKLAARVKADILEATGLQCTIAVATGKIVAKVAADCHKPDGTIVVPPTTEAAFLAPCPIRALPGIGPKTGASLEALGIRTIGDLLEPRFESALRGMWGTRLLAMRALAQGRDDDPVEPERDQQSLGHETTFDADTDDRAVLEATVRAFLSELTHDLRVQSLAAGTFTVKLKDAHFHVTTRRRCFSMPLNYDPLMWRAIQPAIQSLVTPRSRYRLIGLSLSDLSPAMETLFDRRTAQAVAAMDGIIERYGPSVMCLGNLPQKHR